MQQQTIFSCPIKLYRVRPETGELVDKGACVCALVGLPSQPPKYSFVCYDSAQKLHCVGRLSASNDTGLQFRVDPGRTGYASFRDDLLDTWTFVCSQPEQLVRLLAEIGVAYYGLNGRQASRPWCALRTFSDVCQEGLAVGVHEALAQYVAFAIVSKPPVPVTDSAGAAPSWLPTSERVVEATTPATELFSASHDTASRLSSSGTFSTEEEEESGEPRRPGPYRFFPIASMHAAPPSYRGFESAMNGLPEGAYSVVIVPAASWSPAVTGAAASPLTPLRATDVVFVVRLMHVRHRDVRAIITNGADGRAAVANRPPAVFAETEGQHALVPYTQNSTTSDTNRELALVPTPADSLAALSVPQTAVGAVGGPGIPLSHMTLIQKVAAGVQSAIVTTRDIRDVASGAEETWTYTVNRPKPSALSNTALVEQVQALVRAAETRASESARYDDLIRTMETQNKTTQREIEELSRRCGGLLKSRHTVESAAVDANLERRRLLLRLKEELARNTEEREDTRRHTDSARKLLQTATEVLRVERGKLDIQRVHQQTWEGRLTAALEMTSVERARRGELEAKSVEVQSEVRRAQAELRLVTDRLHTLQGKADSERDRYAALMEDERHRISSDALELRQNAIAELQRQETQHRAVCAEMQRDHYQRGYAEGRATGKEASTMDLSVHRQELSLEAQRSKDSLIACKEELQRGLEAALALRRSNESSLQAIKHQLSEALERRAQLEMQSARLANHRQGEIAAEPTTRMDMRSPTAAAQTQEAVLACLQRLLSGVSVPLPPSLLYSVVEIAQRGDDTLPVSLVTQLRDVEETYVRDELVRRAGWVEEELFSVYTKGEAVYYQSWIDALQTAHADLRTTIHALVQQHGGSLAVALYDVWLLEADTRQTIESSRDAFMATLAAHQSAQAEQRAKLLREATTDLRSLFRGFERGLRAIRLLLESHVRAQTQLVLEETESRLTLEREADVAARGLPQAFADLQLGRHVAEQRLLLESEEASRAALMTDECTAFSGLAFRASSAAEEVVRAVQTRERCRTCDAEETRERALILNAEALARRTLQDALCEVRGMPTAADMPVPPPPLSAPSPPSAVAGPPAPTITPNQLPSRNDTPGVAPTPPTPPPRTESDPVAPPAAPSASSVPVLSAALTPPPASVVAPAPAPPPPSISNTRAVIADDDDAFDNHWLSPPPPLAPSGPPPLPPADDEDEAATDAKLLPSPPRHGSPRTPERSSADTSVLSASPVAGLAMVEQRWRTQRPHNVLDGFASPEAPAEPRSPPPSALSSTQVVPQHSAPPSAPMPPPLSVKAEKTHTPASVPAVPKLTSTPTLPPTSSCAPDKFSTAAMADSDSSDSLDSAQDEVTGVAAGGRVEVQAETSRSPPQAKPLAKAFREASKAATAAQAAAARAEKMKLFESSDDD